MIVKVQILAGDGEEQIVEVAEDATYETVLQTLRINPEEVILLRNGKPVPEDERLSEKGNATAPTVTVIRIVSSG